MSESTPRHLGPDGWIVNATTPYRVAHIGIDAYHPNRRPKTERYCVICQRDIKPTARAREVHLVDGGMWALHTDDEPNYVSDSGDVGMHLLGMDCARRLGMEYSRHEEAA